MKRKYNFSCFWKHMLQWVRYFGQFIQEKNLFKRKRVTKRPFIALGILGELGGNNIKVTHKNASQIHAWSNLVQQGTIIHKCTEIDAFLFFYLLFISPLILELEQNYHRDEKKRQNIKDEEKKEEEEVYIYKGIKLNALCVFHFVPMIEYINISFSSVCCCCSCCCYCTYIGKRYFFANVT